MFLTKLRIRLDRKILANLLTPVINESQRFSTKYKETLGQQDPDSFGTLSKEWRLNKTLDSMPEEEDDRLDINYHDDKVGKTRLRTKEYADMIKQLVKEKRIPDALNVLEQRMIKEDRVQPENYIFNLLIGACARVGYTKKAFKLYNQMKKRALKITGGTYTSLFNACANSPWSTDGLERARHLRELMTEKAYTPNQSNYHAMMKAFGHCGDLPTAFSLVDEMVSNGIKPTSDTFNFLLHACISDKKAGFRHGLLVWRKMVEKNVKPTIYNFNLLLRCVRDCSVGDHDSIIEDIGKMIENPRKKMLGEVGPVGETLPAQIEEITRLEIPNLLETIPHIGSVVKLGNVTKASHRLMLVGGLEGFLNEMSLNGVPPDIKTMTQLLDIIPSKLETENALLEQTERHKVKLDIGFCNMLMKKRCMRSSYNDAREVLKLISGNHLKPDIMTFGILALTCRTPEESKQLLTDLEETGYRVNIEILSSLLRSAIYTWDLNTVFDLMKMVQSEGLKPNGHFMGHLKEFHDFVKNEIQTKENGGRPHKKIKDKYFMDGFKKFCYFYNNFKKDMEVEDEEKTHPWHQFKQDKNKKVAVGH